MFNIISGEKEPYQMVKNGYGRMKKIHYDDMLQTTPVTV